MHTVGSVRYLRSMQRPLRSGDILVMKEYNGFVVPRRDSPFLEAVLFDANDHLIVLADHTPTKDASGRTIRTRVPVRLPTGEIAFVSPYRLCKITR